MYKYLIRNEGPPINDLRQLRWAAYKHRSVVCPGFIGFTLPRPAAFVLNMSGGTILRMFVSGMFLYEKNGRKRLNDND